LTKKQEHGNLDPVKKNKTAEVSWKFDLEGFSRAITGRLESSGLSLRDAAKEIGVSSATLWRSSRHMPDVHTVALICKWLPRTLDSFVVQNGSGEGV